MKSLGLVFLFLAMNVYAQNTPTATEAQEFILMIDQWRWKVFSGEIAPADYNQAWWALRLKYQGVVPPVARSEADFDPGAKYHVAANVPYTRYFLAHILEFQFYRALCRESGYKGPLNRGRKSAGKTSWPRHKSGSPGRIRPGARKARADECVRRYASKC